MWVKAIWAVCVVLLSGVVRADTPTAPSARDIVEYRQQMMRTLDAQFTAVMLILTHRAPVTHIDLHMEALLETSKLGFKVFEPAVYGGGSRHKVWDDWEGFSVRMNEFNERLTTAVMMTRTFGAPGALQGLEYVSCSKCHDGYRERF
jgi:cytochrome c556